MARTESKTFTCHPNDEQELINAMQKFQWSLLSSQDVKTVDNSLEMRGNSLYSVRKSEHYVKLTFSRDLDLPNLNEIKKLEETYNGLREPECPNKSISGLSVVLGLIASVPTGLTVWFLSFSFELVIYATTIFILFIILGFKFFDMLHERECVPEYQQNLLMFTQERQKILSEVAKYQ
jgi:hypothetical protein